MTVMVTWKQFSEEVPALADAVQARFKAHKHHVLATLRKDGSPRVSGTEVEILDGRLVLGSMFGALKAKDLIRDGRYALHSNPGEHTMEGGDAKIAGIAREVTGDEFEAVLASYTYEVRNPCTSLSSTSTRWCTRRSTTSTCTSISGSRARRSPASPSDVLLAMLAVGTRFHLNGGVGKTVTLEDGARGFQSVRRIRVTGQVDRRDIHAGGERPDV